MLELPKHRNILKAQTVACIAGSNIKLDSITNYSITINGKQNLVTIKTDSLTIQTPKSLNNKSKNSNNIEIIGGSNSVSVYQEMKGRVVVKQSGNNNHINISQSSRRP